MAIAKVYHIARKNYPCPPGKFMFDLVKVSLLTIYIHKGKRIHSDHWIEYYTLDQNGGVELDFDERSKIIDKLILGTSKEETATTVIIPNKYLEVKSKLV